jgi:hypothetical protein
LEDHFLKTFPFEDQVTLVVEKSAQKCKTGDLFSEGWRDQMIEKQLFINKQFQTHEQNELLLFTDVDISFYGALRDDLASQLGDKDICFMKDHNSDELGRCGGFFVTRQTNKMKEFFESVLKRLSSHTDENVAWETSEQSTINALLNEKKDINWGYLSNRYYTHGLHTHGIENFSDDNQSGLWWQNKTHTEKSNILVPQNILVHHANWAKGIATKLDVLRWVKDIHTFNSNKPKKRGR